MPVVPRMSLHLTTMLRVLGERPGSITPTELLGAARIPPSIGYPILHRLCDRGLLVRHWEDIDPVAEGRPRGCYYTLTRLGAAHLPAATE